MSDPWIIKFDDTNIIGVSFFRYYSKALDAAVVDIRLAARYSTRPEAARALFSVQQETSDEMRWTGRVVRLRLKGAK